MCLRKIKSTNRAYLRMSNVLFSVVNQAGDISKYTNASSISSDQLFHEDDDKKENNGQRVMKGKYIEWIKEI